MTKQREKYGTDLRIWDNGGATMDRYTIVPPRWTKECREHRGWVCLFSGADPRGMSGRSIAEPGPHLGRRIHVDELPEAVRNLTMREWPQFF